MEWSPLLGALLGLIGLSAALLLAIVIRARRELHERVRLRRAELIKCRLEEPYPPSSRYRVAEIKVHQGTQ
jgi:hypothetical protein